MNHKEHQITLWLAFFILISVLLLAWPPLLTHVGADLPPRATPISAQPPDNDDDDKPAGAHIVLQVESAPAGVWTIVQWQDSAGGWHGIKGWQGTLDEGDQKSGGLLRTSLVKGRSAGWSTKVQEETSCWPQANRFISLTLRARRSGLRCRSQNN